MYLLLIPAAACAAIFILVYRSFRAPFFLVLLAAILGLAGALMALAFSGPGVDALSDLFLAAGGAGMAAASWQLRYAFRLAGDGHD